MGGAYVAGVTASPDFPATADDVAIQADGKIVTVGSVGFSGEAPDRGAIIDGRTVPIYGDRTGIVVLPPPPPPPPSSARQ